MRYRLVRFIGDPTPWEDQILSRALMAGHVPTQIVRQLDFYNKWQRQICYPGTTKRVLSEKYGGFSRTYEFGPEQFAVYMTEPDAAKLFANEWDRWSFLDITDNPGQTERPQMSRGDWQRLLASFAKIGKGRRRKYADGPRVQLGNVVWQ